jgi:Fe2+ transport system protein FeoA
MLLPLDMLQPGDRGEIAAVNGDPAWIGRLAELGVREGGRVCVLQAGSPCLIDLAGTRLCLRGGECARILVRPLPTAAV